MHMASGAVDWPNKSALLAELVFLEAWEDGLFPVISGILRVRQFRRAYPAPIAPPKRLAAAHLALDGPRRFKV